MAVLSPKGLNRPTGDRCMVVEVCGSQVVSPSVRTRIRWRGLRARAGAGSECALTASPLGVPHVICANSEREELDRLAKVWVGAVVSGVVQLGRPRRLQLRYQLELLVAILSPTKDNEDKQEGVEDSEEGEVVLFAQRVEQPVW